MGWGSFDLKLYCTVVFYFCLLIYVSDTKSLQEAWILSSPAWQPWNQWSITGTAWCSCSSPKPSSSHAWLLTSGKWLSWESTLARPALSQSFWSARRKRWGLSRSRSIVVSCWPALPADCRKSSRSSSHSAWALPWCVKGASCSSARQRWPGGGYGAFVMLVCSSCPAFRTSWSALTRPSAEVSQSGCRTLRLLEAGPANVSSWWTGSGAPRRSWRTCWPGSPMWPAWSLGSWSGAWTFSRMRWASPPQRSCSKGTCCTSASSGSCHAGRCSSPSTCLSQLSSKTSCWLSASLLPSTALKAGEDWSRCSKCWTAVFRTAFRSR